MLASLSVPLFPRGLTVVSVKGLSSVGGVTRLAYTVESGGVGPWGGAPRAMLHEAGQYCFINVRIALLYERNKDEAITMGQSRYISVYVLFKVSWPVPTGME